MADAETTAAAPAVDKEALLSKSLDELKPAKKAGKNGAGKGGGGKGGGAAPKEKLEMTLEELAASSGPKRHGNTRGERKHNPTGKGSANGGKKGGKGTGKGNGSKGKGAKGNFGGKGRGSGGRPSSDKYKAYESVYWNEAGDLVVALRENEVIHVTPDGKFRVSTGGVHDLMTLSCMNAALEPFRVEITPEQGLPSAKTWGISDNKSWSVKLIDGMTLPPFGNSNPAVRSGRASLLMKNKEIQNPNAISG